MLDLLVASTVRLSVLLVLALLVVRAAARASAATRHCILAAAVCGALLTPLLLLTLPRWSAPVWQATTGDAAARPDASTARADATTVGMAFTLPSPSAPARSGRAGARAWQVGTTIVGGIWLAGVVAGVVLLLASLWRLGRIARAAAPVVAGPWAARLVSLTAGDSRLSRIVLLQSTHPSLLVTWGWRHPRILLPRAATAWQRDRIDVVLAHEIEHVRRGDWLLQLAAELLRVLAWFNPLAWLAASRLRLESERACDDAVLQRGVQPHDYAEHLLHVARALMAAPVWIPAPAMARPSSLERRVSAMLDSGVVRKPVTRFMRRVVIAAGFAATASIASFAAQSTFATFSGTVHDQLGGTIPKVPLVLTHSVSGAKYEVRTNGSGNFEFVGLTAGNYTLDVATPGFKMVHDAMQLTGGQTLRRDLTLQVGALEETISVTDGPATPVVRRPAPKSTAAAPAACTAEPNSGRISPPAKVKDVRPVYPASMQGTGIPGLVVLQAVIGTDGAVRETQTTSATNPDFEVSAQEAVRQWRFTQTMLNCVPVDVEMQVTVAFAPQKN